MLGKTKRGQGTDNSIGKIEGNKYHGNVGNIITGIGITVQTAEQRRNNTNEISDQEWLELAKFFLERQLSTDAAAQEYKEQCARAEDLAKKKDKKGLKDFFCTTGKSLLQIILGGSVQAGIREIISKITD